MTTTMTLGTRLKHRDTPRGGTAFYVRTPGRRLLDAIRQSLSSTVSTGLGRRTAPSLIPSAVDREITAIDSFAHFLSMHPDMPREHRDRFLRQILRSCEELRKDAARALSPGNPRNN